MVGPTCGEKLLIISSSCSDGIIIAYVCTYLHARQPLAKVRLGQIDININYQKFTGRGIWEILTNQRFVPTLQLAPFLLYFCAELSHERSDKGRYLRKWFVYRSEYSISESSTPYRL